jgi:hypothetical protein
MLNKLKSVRTLFLIIVLATTGLAATQPQEKKAEQTQPEVETLKQLKGKVFELKYREPSSVIQALKPLGSGYYWASMNADNDLHVITVRDFPENLAVIEEAIKRLDVPQNVRPKANLEVQLSLIAASRTAGPSGEIPLQISAVLEQLRNTMKYKNYRYITTFINRASDGGNVHSSGAADAFFQLSETKGKQTFYDYIINDIRTVKTEGNEQIIQVRDFHFYTNVPIVVSNGNGGSKIEYQKMEVSTALTMKDGEIIVVGTSNVGSSDEALIIVISIRKV